MRAIVDESSNSLRAHKSLQVELTILIDSNENLSRFKLSKSSRESPRACERLRQNKNESLNSCRLPFSFGPGLIKVYKQEVLPRSLQAPS